MGGTWQHERWQRDGDTWWHERWSQTKVSSCGNPCWAVAEVENRANTSKESPVDPHSLPRCLEALSHRGRPISSW